MTKDVRYTKIYNLTQRITFKCRIDKKIIVVHPFGEPIVLKTIESNLIRFFNGGRTLQELSEKRPISGEIWHVFLDLVAQGYLLETNEHYKADLHPQWTLEEVFFELTKKCNLNCMHCYIPKDIEKNEMTKDEWFHIVDQCKELGVALIKLTGGEAMISPHFWNIVEYISQKEIRMRLYTNGSFLNEENVSRLKKLGVNECQISVDGGTAATHDSFRRVKGNYERIQNALPILQKYEMKVILSYTISDYNQREVENFVELSYQYSNVKIVVSPYMNYHQTSEKKCELHVDDQMVNMLKGLFEKNQYKWSDKTRYYMSFSNQFIGFCGAGTYMLYIDSQGKAMICPLLNQSENIVGDVRKQGLCSVWRESEFLTDYRQRSVSDIEKCGKCSNVNTCRGGCRARAYLKRNMLLSPDEISCQMY